jgi:hypothetical protein
MFSVLMKNGLILLLDSERIRLHVLNFPLFEVKTARGAAAAASNDLGL